MPITRRRFALLAAALTAALPTVASAAETMRIVIPFPAGGISDAIARIVAEKLGTELGTSIVVDPHPGASGLVAARHVINSPEDGTTLFLSSPTIMYILPRTQTLEFNPIETFLPVSNVGSSVLLFAVKKDLEPSTLEDFVSYAKGLPPETLTLATGGTGTSTHLIPSLFFSRADLKLIHVPYKGGAPALQDLVAGQVDTYFGNPAEIMPQAAAGTIKILATSGEERMPELPDVPSVAELYPGVSLTTWNGLFYKAGTPPEMIEKVSAAMQKISQDPAYVEALTKIGANPIGDSAADFAGFIASEKGKWDEAIDAAGIKQQ